MRIKIVMTNGQEIIGTIPDKSLVKFIDRLNKKWLTIGKMSARQENISLIIELEDEKPAEQKPKESQAGAQ